MYGDPFVEKFSPGLLTIPEDEPRTVTGVNSSPRLISLLANSTVSTEGGASTRRLGDSSSIPANTVNAVIKRVEVSQLKIDGEYANYLSLLQEQVVLGYEQLAAFK